MTQWLGVRGHGRGVTHDPAVVRRQAIARLVDVYRIAPGDADVELKACLATEAVLLDQTGSVQRTSGTTVAGGRPAPETLIARATTDRGWVLHLIRRLESSLSPPSLRLFWALYVERLEVDVAAHALGCEPDQIGAAHELLLAEVRSIAAAETSP